MDLPLNFGQNDGEEFLMDMDEKRELQLQEEETKERKLAKLRQQIEKKQEIRKNKESNSQPRGKDFYLRRVSAFLLSSMFLSLASQQFFVYVYLHEFVAAYFDHKVQMFDGLMEGANYCFLNYFAGKILGFIVAAACIIEPIQEDEEIGRKVFSISIVVSSMSMLIATKLMHLMNWPLFVFFYTFVPSFSTGRLPLTCKQTSDCSRY